MSVIQFNTIKEAKDRTGQDRTGKEGYVSCIIKVSTSPVLDISFSS